jgi:pyruvate kinase
MKKIKIICTLGPTSFNKKVLQNLKKQKIDIFRINLSHTNKNNIESRILYLKKNNIKNICLDSEGAQIRTTLCKKKYFLKLNKIIKIFNNDHFSNDKSISMYPSFNITSVKKKTKIYIGFNSLCLEVKKIEKSENYLIAKVIKSGYLESKKGVHINANIKLWVVDFFKIKETDIFCKYDEPSNPDYGIINDVFRELNKQYGANIRWVCDGKRKTAFGYKWEWVNN